MERIVAIDQTPIGRTPRSNPATYTKIFDEIRNIFALTPDARKRGLQTGALQLNVRGRCGGTATARSGRNAFCPISALTSAKADAISQNPSCATKA